MPVGHRLEIQSFVTRIYLFIFWPREMVIFLARSMSNQRRFKMIKSPRYT